MLEFSLMAALLAGLLGGGHCVGMCGGIVGAVTMTLPGSRPKLPFVLAYNLGRIGSYTLAGTVAGAVGAGSFFLEHVLPVEKVLYALAGLMLVLMGLYLSGVWRLLARLEAVGGLLWRHLQPFSKRLLPVRTLPQSLLLGILWGWLPCGLVYSVLVAAIATGSPWRGSLLMLAFGVGTLPTMLAMGMVAVRLRRFLQHPWFRRLSGLVIAGMGLLALGRLMFG
ncbi:MAG TPA: sulfite exporter TauE/SafE family protein [Methylophilaceae bacterium]